MMGFEAVLHYSADGTGWAAMPKVVNATVVVEPGESEATTRGSGVREYEAGKPDYRIEFTMRWDTSDDHVKAVRAAVVGRQKIYLGAYDGPRAEAGSEGPEGQWIVSSLNRLENLNEVMDVSFVARPAKGGGVEWKVTE